MAFELQDGRVNLDGLTVSFLTGEGKGREWMWGLLKGAGTTQWGLLRGIQHAGDSLPLFYPDGGCKELHQGKQEVPEGEPRAYRLSNWGRGSMKQFSQSPHRVQT